MLVKLTNCRLAIQGKLVWKDLWINSATGKIVDSQKAFFDDCAMADEIIDIGGKIVAPGFIDLQINGALGVDFSVPTNDLEYVKNLKLINKTLVKFGVTAYCPTLTSQSIEVYKKTLLHLRPIHTRNPQDGAEVLGAHVEGPFLSAHKHGIHSPTVFRTVEANGFADFETCYGVEDLTSPSPSIPPPIRIITGAPELNGMLEVIKECKSRNIIFSIGHSNATITTAEDAVRSGATLITHLFNAMQQMHHRDPGVIGLLGSDDDLPRPYYGFICDGIHIHKSCVKLAYQSHPEGAILITDAMAQLGLPNGVYDWTNGKKIVKDGIRLHLEGEETIAGSAVTLDECIRNLVLWTSASLAEAILCVTAHPAELLGITHQKGQLLPSMDADLVVLDDSGNVHQTWKFGKKVFDHAEQISPTYAGQSVNKSNEIMKSPPSYVDVPGPDANGIIDKFRKYPGSEGVKGVKVH